MACNPDFFVVKINEFHEISVDQFHFVANIRSLNRKFHVDNSTASMEESKENNEKNKNNRMLEMFFSFFGCICL